MKISFKNIVDLFDLIGLTGLCYAILLLFIIRNIPDYMANNFNDFFYNSNLLFIIYILIILYGVFIVLKYNEKKLGSNDFVKIIVPFEPNYLLYIIVNNFIKTIFSTTSIILLSYIVYISPEEAMPSIINFSKINIVLGIFLTSIIIFTIINGIFFKKKL